MLTLPASHSRGDLDLARRIAHRFESEELHVFWSEAPAVAAPKPEVLPVFGMAIAAVGAFFDNLTSTLTHLGRTAGRF